jgi:FkbH-like protein
MDASTHTLPDQQRLAEALAADPGALIEVWERLGATGPSRGAPEAGTPEEARARYFRPLAHAFIGALRGSANHSAIYFDERLRYIDRTTFSAEAQSALRDDVALEVGEIAELCRHVASVESITEVLWDFHRPLLYPPTPRAKVLFIGDCLFVETRAFLVQDCLASGRPVDVRHIFFSTKQPLAEVNTAIVNEVRNFQPDLIGLSLFTFEGVPPYTYAWRKAAVPVLGTRATGVVDGLVELVRETIADIRSVSDCTIAVHIPCGVPLDPVRRRLRLTPAHSRGQRLLLSGLSNGLSELVESVENVLPLDETALAVALGGVRATAANAFDEDDVPSGYSHTTALGPALAHHYDDLLADHELLGEAKALFVDFDNTLWSGVMAEGEVIHDLVAQRLLLELKNAGVLLVALSKNDESSIRWDEMVLSEDDFALMKINWLPKPDNVSAAISELDLAPNAFVLLDDNPVERALVTETVSGVRALDPIDPQAWRTLRRWLAFPSTRQTEEAQRRTRMYREAAERRAAMSQTHDYDAMMKTLGLRYSVRPALPSDLPRLTELIERTNQFNTTTRRHSQAVIRQLIESATREVLVASLRDRFGSLGVVAVAIVDRDARMFDSVIMSCRAMGFGLEFALLRSAIEAVGPGEYRGLFIPTDRNGPAAELFAQAGFTPEGDGNWVLAPDDAGPQTPAWLARE